MKATQLIGNDNVVYTYLPVSYEALQAAIYNQGVPITDITVTSNITTKTPEKDMPFIDTEQVKNQHKSDIK